jgi:hypothetical protein
MGQCQRRESSEDLLGFDRPSAPPAPRFRYRVVLVARDERSAAEDAELRRRRGDSLVVVWVTNDLAYARALAARVNAQCHCVEAGVQEWNCANIAAQSRWILRRPERQPQSSLRV